MEAVLQKRRKVSCCEDLIVDVAKSAERAPSCVGECPCLVPNSKPFRRWAGKVLGPQEVLGLQGIWKEDFPQLGTFSDVFLRNLAGNAFTATVALAVLLGALVHADFGAITGATWGEGLS